jgi:hypothetical protein
MRPVLKMTDLWKAWVLTGGREGSLTGRMQQCFSPGIDEILKLKSKDMFIKEVFPCLRVFSCSASI